MNTDDFDHCTPKGSSHDGAPPCAIAASTTSTTVSNAEQPVNPYGRTTGTYPAADGLASRFVPDGAGDEEAAGEKSARQETGKSPSSGAESV